MDKSLAKKLVLLGFAKMEYEAAMAEVENFAVVDCKLDRGYVMAVYQTGEGEGVLLWLKGYHTSAAWRKIGSCDFATVSHLCHALDDKLETYVAIYHACRNLGVTRLRSYYSIPLPNMVSIEESKRAPGEHSFEEYARDVKRNAEREGWVNDLENHPRVRFLHELQHRCAEIDGGG